MIANHDTFQEMLQEMGMPATKRKKALLAERSVNIFSDMGDTVYEGDVITVTGELTGFDGLEVALQWQYDNGSRWMDVPGANRLTHSFVATAETINYSWRLSVSAND